MNVTERFHSGLPFSSPELPQNDVWLFSKTKSSLCPAIHGYLGCFHIVAAVSNRKSCHLRHTEEPRGHHAERDEPAKERQVPRDATYTRDRK